MDVETVDIAELKTGQKVNLDIGNREVTLTKLAEPQKFSMEGWKEDEVDIYIMESQIEEDEPLHYAFQPMSLEEGLKRNEGKFGKDLVMFDFLAREVEGIEMEDEEEDEAEEGKDGGED